MPHKTEAQKRAQRKYMEGVATIQIRTTAERRATIQTAAAAAGQSVNAYINQAIDARMEAPVDAQGAIPMESTGSDTEGVQKEREGIHE